MTMALFVKGIINYVRDGVRTVLAQRWLVCMGSPLDSSLMNNTSLCISSILLAFTLLSFFFVTLLDVTYCKRGRQEIKNKIVHTTVSTQILNKSVCPQHSCLLHVIGHRRKMQYGLQQRGTTL